ncbi:MAG: Fic family protein [Solirubrobacterales bacterium]
MAVLMPFKGRYEELSWTPDFAKSGRHNKAKRYRAFFPANIADADPSLSGSTAALAERASRAVSDLNKTPQNLVSLEGLARQLLRSEALASSQIEGLSVSHKKLAEAELEDRQGHHRATEIMGNIRAMERAMAIGTAAKDLTVTDLCEIHAEMAIVPPLDKIAGQLREEPSWIGGIAPPDADYVGPPHELVEPLLKDLCTFMNRDDVPPVPQAAIAHAQFESIHPFGDGNGRVGRCLIHVLFWRRKLAQRYVPPVSLVLGANKDAYIAGLKRFGEGNVDLWISQFARSVETAADQAAQFSGQVIELQANWRDRLGRVRSDAAVLPLINLLPKYPVITAAVAEKEIGRSRQATLTALERLGDADVLTRHRNQKQGDSWEAKELFKLLAQFEAAVKLPTE